MGRLCIIGHCRISRRKALKYLLIQHTVSNKAVDRGDKRTRRLRVRVLALRENPRRVQVRVSTLQEKARRGRVLDTVLRDTPSPRTSTRSLDTGLMDRTLMSRSSAIFYSLAVSCFAKRVNAYMPTCLLLFSRKIKKEASCYLDEGEKYKPKPPAP